MTHNLFVALLVLLMCFQLGCFRRVVNDASKTEASSSPTAPAAKHATAIKAVAKGSAEAILRNDFNTVVDFTYDNLVTILGGREETFSMIEEEMKRLEKGGMTLVSVTVGEPQQIQKIGSQLFSVVPTTLKMKYKTHIVEADSFMIAVSEDNGEIWKLVDGAIAQDKLLRKLFPDAVEELHLPPKKDPVFYEAK